MRFRNWICLALLVSACGCTPTKQPLQTGPASELNIGPKNPAHSINWTASLNDSKSNWFWNAQEGHLPTRSADYFDMADNLILLGRQTQSKKIQRLGHQFISRFYKNKHNYSSFGPDDVLYLRAALGAKREEIKKLIAQAPEDLSPEREKIVQVLEKTKKTFAWPQQQDVDANSLIPIIEKYLNWLIGEFHKANVHPQIIDSFKKALHKDHLPTLKKIGQDLLQIENKETLKELVGNIRQVTEKIELRDMQDIEQKVLQGESLASQLDRLENGGDVLRILVHLWSILSPEERVNHFEAVNKDLYQYLNNLDEPDIACLLGTSNQCKLGLVSWFKKAVVTYNLGGDRVNEIKGQLNQATVNYTKNELDKTLKNVVAELPDILRQKILADLDNEIAQLERLRYSLDDYYNSITQNWVRQSIFAKKKSLPAIERSTIKVKYSRKSGPLISPADTSSSLVTTSSTIGASLAVAPLRWSGMDKFEGVEVPSPRFSQAVLPQIGKLLALTGFPIDSEKRFSSFYLPIEGKRPEREFLDLPSYFDNKNRFYAVPDQFHMVSSYYMDWSEQKPRSTVSAQADLLRGSARMMNFFNPAQTNIFDQGLGHFAIADISQDIPAEFGQERIFQKDILFDLSLGSAALVVENLTRKHSNLILLNSDKQLFRGSELELAQSKMATLAAVVDTVKGQPGTTITSMDMSKFIIGLYELYSALDQVSARHFAEVESVKMDVKYLIIGMSNFLTSKMQSANGGIVDSYALDPMKANPTQRYLLKNQVKAIRALLLASRATGAAAYKWAATDIHYFMNQELWNNKINFYSDDMTKPKRDPILFAEAVTTLADLESSLPQASQPQKNIRLALRHWLNHLERR